MQKRYAYFVAGALVLLLVLIANVAWRERVRDDAHRDSIIAAQNSGIAEIRQKISADRDRLNSELADLERERKMLAVQPARAPEIIRELVPGMAAPTPTPTSSQSPVAPDAPSALTPRQQAGLADYALTCKECELTRDALQQQVKDEQDEIARQKVQLQATNAAAKGGTLRQRMVRILKWGAVFGGIGYVVGRAQR
jgi:hypothetical protein